MSRKHYHISVGPDSPPSREASKSETQQAGADNVVSLPPARGTSEPHPSSDAEQPAEHDENWPFVPPGEYELVFVRDKKIVMWNRPVWFVHMQIIDQGEHFGKIIPFYLNALPQRKRPTPGWYICSAFAIATERRPPKDLWRRRPKSFLSGCVFLGRVRSITRDSRHVELPEAAHKSRVDYLVERRYGTPPYLWKKNP